jgi:nucleoside-diphosphate kinase
LLVQFDPKQRRTFLRRTKNKSLKEKDLTLGTSINLFGRNLHLKSYSDQWTQDYMRKVQKKENFKLMYCYGELKQMFRAVRELKSWSHFYLRQLYLLPRERVGVMGFESNEPGRVDPGLKSIDMTCITKQEFDHLTQHIGMPQGSKDCSVLVIKPHGVSSGQVISILFDLLEAGFHVVGAITLRLSYSDASDFLEVYKGVLPELNVCCPRLNGFEMRFHQPNLPSVIDR